jgi:hypothetical protein
MIKSYIYCYCCKKWIFPHYSQVRRTVVTRVHEAVKALALCHNVTPVRKGEGNGESEESSSPSKQDGITDDDEGEVGAVSDDFTYQASSPDEVRSWALIITTAISCIFPGRTLK